MTEKCCIKSLTLKMINFKTDQQRPLTVDSERDRMLNCNVKVTVLSVDDFYIAQLLPPKVEV